MSEAFLKDWYVWRWSQVFATAESVPEPKLSDTLARLLPVESSGMLTMDALEADHHGLGGELTNLAPSEVIRLRAITAGTVEFPLRDLVGDEDLSIGDLVAALHRVRLKVVKLAERYDPLYGELPEGQYLSSVRTQFMLDFAPSAKPEDIVGFYQTACRKLNRLLLAKGPKVQSAVSSASRILNAVESLDGVMGLLATDSQVYLALDRSCGVHRAGLSMEDVQKKVNLRIAARTARDWAQADLIQGQLAALGVTLNDGEGVTDWWIPYSA